MYSPGMNVFQRIGKSLRNNTVVGLILVTPIALTAFIINLLFNFTTNFLPRELKESDQALMFRFVALAAVLILLFFVGLFVRNILGKKLYRLGDRILTRIPIINRIYVTLRQVSETLIAQKETLFKEVVLVEYPRKGLYSMGFLTAYVPPNIEAIISARSSQSGPYAAIFIPTTPNPTSGWFVLVERSEMIPLAISITDAMKLVLSGGAVFPGQSFEGDNPHLLEKLEKIVFGTPSDTRS